MEVGRPLVTTNEPPELARCQGSAASSFGLVPLEEDEAQLHYRFEDL
jgi:hypothetical protein